MSSNVRVNNVSLLELTSKIFANAVLVREVEGYKTNAIPDKNPPISPYRIESFLFVWHK